MEFLGCIFCQKKFPLEPTSTFCPECQEPMLYFYSQKKRKFQLDKKNPLERFLDFLPLSNINEKLFLGEGNTPLIELARISKLHNLPSVLAKNEISNPTGSFKDRGTTVSVQKAVAMGIETIGTVSTGNMAASTAAFAAKAGLKAVVLVKEDVSSEKLLSTGVYNPLVIKVKGDFGDLFYKSFEMGKKFNIYFTNSIDPFRIEGYKVTGFEIFLQLNFKAPRYIFAPLSSGGHLIGLMKSFLELKQQGIIHRMPKFVGVQAQGCSPISQAFATGQSRVKRITKAETIAQAISNPDPPGGNMVLRMIRENNGTILDVSDEEILSAQKNLAELEGIFCQPASATPWAGLLKFSNRIELDKEDRIVLVITGSGLKTTKILDPAKINIQQATLDNLDSVINASL